MKRFLLIAALGLMFTSMAHAQFHNGDRDFTLSGGGTTDRGFHDGSFNVNASVGYFLTGDFEIGLRQSVVYNKALAGDTAVFADYNFRLMDGKLDPFVGISGGYNYGSVTANQWSGGPEVGVRYFVNSTTYLYGSASYQFDLNRGLSTGAFTYGLGVGFRF